MNNFEESLIPIKCCHLIPIKCCHSNPGFEFLKNNEFLNKNAWTTGLFLNCAFECCHSTLPHGCRCESCALVFMPHCERTLSVPRDAAVGAQGQESWHSEEQREMEEEGGIRGGEGCSQTAGWKDRWGNASCKVTIGHNLKIEQCKDRGMSSLCSPHRTK